MVAVKSDEEIMEILEAYDLTGSYRKAAELAGVSWQRMREILLSRGLQPRLGPETQQEALEEVEALRRHLDVSGR